MRISHAFMIILSGAVWLLIGLFLLIKGLGLLVTAAHFSAEPFLITPLVNLAGTREQAALLLVALSLVVGFLKGRFVLAKTVKRSVERIFSFPSPVPLAKIYNKASYLIIFFMMGLGMLMRVLPISPDVRGAVDVAVGAALINGALLYFRCAFATKGQRSLDN
jgi:hypothetical protein